MQAKSLTLGLGLALTLLLQMPAMAQVSFGKAFQLSAAQLHPAPVPETLPAVRPIAQSPGMAPMQAIAQPQPVPQHVDFNQILSDPCCNQCSQGCTQCEEVCECEDTCCLDKLIYGDYRHAPRVVREDPAVLGSMESLYQTPDCCRGFWATYPEEKRLHCQKLQSILNPPDPDCEECQGPQLYCPQGCESGASCECASNKKPSLR